MLGGFSIITLGSSLLIVSSNSIKLELSNPSQLLIGLLERLSTTRFSMKARHIISSYWSIRLKLRSRSLRELSLMKNLPVVKLLKETRSSLSLGKLWSQRVISWRMLLERFRNWRLLSLTCFRSKYYMLMLERLRITRLVSQLRSEN